MDPVQSTFATLVKWMKYNIFTKKLLFYKKKSKVVSVSIYFLFSTISFYNFQYIHLTDILINYDIFSNNFFIYSFCTPSFFSYFHFRSYGIVLVLYLNHLLLPCEIVNCSFGLSIRNFCPQNYLSILYTAFL